MSARQAAVELEWVVPAVTCAIHALGAENAGDAEVSDLTRRAFALRRQIVDLLEDVDSYLGVPS